MSTNDYTTAEKTKLENLAEIKTVGTGLNLDDNGELTATGGGSGGTTNYNDLSNKPQINGNTLSGNKTSAQLGLASASDIPTTLADLSDDSTHRTVSDTEKATWNAKQNAISDLETIRSGAAAGATAVQPVSGKGLSTNDYTDVEKTKLAGIAEGAEVNEIESIKVNNTTINPDANKVVNITIPTTAADVSALPDTTKYAAALSLTINSSTFVMTGQLKDQNGDNLGTAQTIDLPLESVVVGGSYNSQTKKVVLTLQNGNTIEFSVADLVSGLQTELSATNKLNPAYINYDNTHRAVSDAEKSTWNGKQNALSSTQLDAVNSGIDSTKVTQIETNENNILSLTQYGGGINKFQVTATTTTVNGITFTVNADKTITATGSIADSSQNAIFTMGAYTAVSGDVLSEGFTEANPNAYIYARGGSTSLTTETYKAIFENDIGVQRNYACAILGKTVGQVNITFKPMICNSDSYAKSSVYQPYALSNAELTAKEQQNESNISMANAELIELVDSGAKNKIFVDKLNTTNANGVTYTINNDGTITVNGTPSGSSPSYAVVAMPDGSTYKNFAEFCNGDNILSGCPTGGSNNTYRMYITGTGYTREDFGTGVELTDTSVSPLYLILYIYNGYTADNLTFKPMICNKSAWDISHAYQPYRPPYQELYEKVETNKNNISVIDILSTVTAASGYTIDSKSTLYKQGKHVFGTLIIQKSTAYSTTQYTAATLTYKPAKSYLGGAFLSPDWGVTDIGYVYIHPTSGELKLQANPAYSGSDTYMYVPLDFVTA